MNIKTSQTPNSILIVDDSPVSREGLALALADLGYDVLTAATGEEAIQVVHETPPNLILLDMVMPTLTGIEVCQQLKASKSKQHIPIIFISALADVESKIKALQAGAVDYIVKPFYMKELHARIEAQMRVWLLHARLHEQNAQLEQEILKREKMKARLIYELKHDMLTGLLNRVGFIEEVTESLIYSHRDIGYTFGVLVLDLDRFKIINDIFGVSIGDQMLVTIGRRLKAYLRHGDILGRVGGDEFAILFSGLKDMEEVTALTRQIQHIVSVSIMLDGNDIPVTASAGLVLSKRSYQHSHDVLRDADMAAHHAKLMGGASFVIYEDGMHTQKIERLQLESDMRRAIEKNELRVYYQPIYSLHSKSICGLEALMRWEHSEFGLLTPAHFIPLAEETGMIVPMGQWLIKTALSDLKKWQLSGYPDLTMAINMSKRQLLQNNLVEWLLLILKDAEIDVNDIELEITEGVLTQSIDFSVLHDLQGVGFKFSIDDFGIGSSLESLKLFPLSTLKIDQTFTRGMLSDPDDRVITTGMIQMAQNLRLKVIAEGVETAEQLAFLETYNCDEIQGYYFSRPVPADAIPELMQKYQSDKSESRE